MKKKKKTLYTRTFEGGGGLGIANSVISGGLALAGSMASAYKKADHNDYTALNAARTAAKQAGNTQFYAEDASGLMDLYNNKTNIQHVNLDDVDKSTAGTAFNDMFNAGMQGWQATKQMTSPLNGMDLNNPSAGDIMDMQLTKQANDKAASYNNGLPTEVNMSNLGYNSQSELAADYSEAMQAYGGPLKHTFEGGGDMLASGLNLLGAGLTMGMSAIGSAAARNKAKALIANLEALNSFAAQRQAGNFNKAVEDSKDNMFNNQALQMMAFGGDLSTQGADFPMLGNFNVIGNGGTHEMNPQNGVPQGMAADGQLNLVELDEVVWNDYVFSNRLMVPKAVRQKYKMKQDMSFADVAKKLAEEASERPNDPISNNSIEVLLGGLRNAQEDLKMKRDAAKMKRAINKMSPEELMGLQQMLAQALQPQLTQPQMPQEMPQEQMMPQEGMPMEGQPMMAAYGGNIYRKGGRMTLKDRKLEDVGMLWDQVANYGTEGLTKKEIKTLRKSSKKYPGLNFPSIDAILKGGSIPYGEVDLDGNGYMLTQQGALPYSVGTAPIPAETSVGTPPILASEEFANGGHIFRGTQSGSNRMTRAQYRAALREARLAAQRQANQLKIVDRFVGNFNDKQVQVLLGLLGSEGIGNTGTTADIQTRLNALKGYSIDQLTDAVTRAKVLNILDINNIQYNKIGGADPDSPTALYDRIINMYNQYANSLKLGNAIGYYKPDAGIDARAVENTRGFQVYRDALWKIAAGEALPEGDADYDKYRGLSLEQALQIMKAIDARNHTKGSTNPVGGPEDILDAEGKLKTNAKAKWDKFGYDHLGGVHHLWDQYVNQGNGLYERTVYRDRNGNVLDVNPEDLPAFYKTPTQQDDTWEDKVEDGISNRYVTHNYVLDPLDYQPGEAPTDVPGEGDPENPLPEFWRYAPILGSLWGAGNAMTEQPKDYSTAVTPRLSTYEPIGDYLQYNPVDTQRYLNAENQLAAAQRNAIMNASGANRNQAMALMALANQQRQQGINEIINSAEAMNFARRALVGEFNRGTNQANAQAFAQSSALNMGVNNFNLNLAQQNQQMRYRVNDAIDQSKGENLSQLFDNIGALGSENLAYNLINSNQALYFVTNGNPFMKGLSQYRGNRTPVTPTTATTTVGKFGGMLTKKTKNNRRK